MGLSDGVAERIKAERERIEAERECIEWKLSERELGIVRRLGDGKGNE